MAHFQLPREQANSTDIPEQFDENNRWFWCLGGHCHVVTGAGIFAGIFTLIGVILLGMSIFWLAQDLSGGTLFAIALITLIINALCWLGILKVGFEMLILLFFVQMALCAAAVGVILLVMSVALIMFAIEGVNASEFSLRIENANLGVISEYAAESPSNLGPVLVFLFLILLAAMAASIWICITTFHCFRYLRARRLFPYETTAQELAAGASKPYLESGLPDDHF
uniref:Uncharacterized protein n=2 Tax=Plectus sambesii TaxID=2011161 RepID=A0A914XKE7_9BILA